MPITYAEVLDTQLLTNSQFTVSGGNTASADLQNIEGTALLTISDRAGGTAAATLTVTHSEDDTTFGAIPADALFTPADGVAATFTDLSTSASFQSLGLLVQKLKRYVRVEIAGTTITHDLAIMVTGGKQYTGGIG